MSKKSLGKPPLTPSTNTLAAKKQILVLVTADQHRALAKKAETAGTTIQSLIRDHFDRIEVVESRTYARLEQLLLTRIGTQLEIVAEQCRNIAGEMMALEISARLIGIERELKEWKEKKRTA